MRTHVTALLSLLLLGLFLSPRVALAEEKLKIQVEVVLASNKGDVVDPPELEKMRETFRKQNFSFTSFKRLSLETLELDQTKTTEVRLPNGVNATLKLSGLKDGIATVHVEVPKQSAVDVELGRQGSVYQKAGKHVGGELILVLSAPTK